MRAVSRRLRKPPPPIPPPPRYSIDRSRLVPAADVPAVAGLIAAGLAAASIDEAARIGRDAPAVPPVLCEDCDALMRRASLVVIHSNLRRHDAGAYKVEVPS